MKTVAFIPIRLNSKRVPGKNIKIIGGKPLLCHIMEKLTQINNIDEVYVYCSDESVKKYLPPNVIFLKREKCLDSDDTLGQDIYDAFVSMVEADIYILAHATSPFIRKDTIENALNKVMYDHFDSAFSVEKIQTFAWYKNHPLNYNLKEIPRTQTIEPIYIETSAFFIFKSEVWKQHRQRIGFNPYMAIVDRYEGIDIDWPEDFELAARLMNISNDYSL